MVGKFRMIRNSTFYARTCTDSNSGVHREFWRDLTASSAVNLPITSASLRFIVVWMGVRSIRCTYLGTWVPPRFTFTTNFVFFIVCHYFCPPPRNAAQNVAAFSEHHRSTIQPVRYWKELKEVLTTHGHRTSPVHYPECPTFHDGDTQSSF